MNIILEQKIRDLETKINQARKDYYNGQSKVSDKVYDVWIDELSVLDPKNLAVIGIGSDPISNWEKYTHLVPMGSLNKCQTEAEYKTWHDKYIAVNDEIFLTLKLDGLSVSLIYENGVLVKGSTRGGGICGELITPNIAKMIGVPLRLSDKIDITVRGEILLSKENHLKYFPEYSNPRNAASGICRRYDGKGSEHLSILTYDLISDFDLKTQQDLFKQLQNLGFQVPDFYVIKSYDNIIKMKNDYQSSLRDKFAYLLDGLVIHNNSLDKHSQAGSLHGRPYASIAYKFDSIAKEAFISDILIQVGNSGRLTPVAVFNPKVDLCGAQVGKASLHNFANITELGIDIGCNVLVCRSNDVIPYVEEVSQSTGTIFPIPTVCPICGTKIIQTGEYLQCPNVSGCSSQISGRIKNWIKELNVLEWGTGLIEKLVESGKVTTVADLYTLTVADLASIDRMGNKSAKKCFDSLWNNNEVSLDVFIGALSIPTIGKSTIKLIIKAGCDTLEKFGQLDTIHFEQVQSVGPVKAKFLADGLRNNQQLILDLLKNGVSIKDNIIGKLTGKSFAVTGTLSIKRSEIEKIIADNGGEFRNSVGKNLTYLIIADPQSTSSKAQAARKVGTTLIDENTFLNMIK